MNDQNKAEVVRLARKGLSADLIAVRINDSSRICMDECVSVEEVQEEIDWLKSVVSRASWSKPIPPADDTQ